VNEPRGIDVQKRMPDWHFIYTQMQARHQTLLQLWEEYCLVSSADAYSYSQFTHYYRRYIERIDVSMRQTYYAGELAFVDYAGRTVTWYDLDKGIEHKAQIFLGVLGCSNYSFVWASASQKLEDWIEAHVKMFEFFGGCPQVIVPDNLKSAVTKPGSFPILNRSYLECIRHYGTAIDPARVRRPRDKAKVEAGVLFISRWILTILARRKFFSIDEINTAIRELLEKFNNRKFKRLPGTRRSRFDELDKPLLKSLPAEAFQYAEWVSEQKVPPDYHIHVKQHAYSVPYQLVSEKVEARIALRTVEIFHLNQRIALHQRCDEQGGYTTSPIHRPPQHQAYAAQTMESFCKWAQHIGPAATQVVQAQFEGKPEYSLLGRKACMQLSKLCNAHSEARFEAACLRAVEIGSLTVKSVRSILQHHLELPIVHDHPVQPDLPLHYHVRGSDYYLRGGL
jgi:transposase